MSDQAVSQLSLNVESTNFSEPRNWEYTDTLSKQGKAAGFQDLTSDASDMTIGDLSSTDQGMCVL